VRYRASGDLPGSSRSSTGWAAAYATEKTEDARRHRSDRRVRPKPGSADSDVRSHFRLDHLGPGPLRRVKDLTIDLDCVVIGAVKRRATHVAVHLPRVTLRARSAGGAEVDHRVELEMRVWGGTVEQHPRRLPRPLSDWGLYHAGGKRKGPLPPSFSLSGNLRLVLTFVADEPLVITGSRLTLRVLKRPVKPAPSKRGTIRQASRRVRVKLRP
jgi:hypothetical protein